MGKRIILSRIISSIPLGLALALINATIFTIGLFVPVTGQECSKDEAYDPISGKCDYIFGPCPKGETRGESGFCAPISQSCPIGTAIDEDPVCEPIQHKQSEGEIRNIHWAE